MHMGLDLKWLFFCHKLTISYGILFWILEIPIYFKAANPSKLKRLFFMIVCCMYPQDKKGGLVSSAACGANLEVLDRLFQNVLMSKRVWFVLKTHGRVLSYFLTFPVWLAVCEFEISSFNAAAIETLSIKKPLEISMGTRSALLSVVCLY